ncbi:hypothetical protein IJ103_01475 [Candidatus Saccharibacteria bacterium]|nr:hypothetical protein [Candidatus Saccharibacteria bacterium]
MKAGKGIVVVVTKTDLLRNRSIKGLQNNKEISPRKITNARGAESAKGSGEVPPERCDFEGREISRSEAPLSSISRILDDLEYDFNFLPYAPVLLTSSETGKNVTKLFDLALQIDEARHHELKTSDLNKILRDAVTSHPPAGLKNTRPKPKYIVQTDTCPPWFVIYGHDLKLLHWSYKRFLERKIREFYPFIGTPIMLSFRSEDGKKGNLK